MSQTDKITRSDDEWRGQLNEEQYRVTRQAGTERAFTGKYLDTKTLDSPSSSPSRPPAGGS